MGRKTLRVLQKRGENWDVVATKNSGSISPYVSLPQGAFLGCKRARHSSLRNPFAPALEARGPFYARDKLLL